MTRVQYAVNGLALLALTVGLAIYDIRTLGCLLMRGGRGGDNRAGSPRCLTGWHHRVDGAAPRNRRQGGRQ